MICLTLVAVATPVLAHDGEHAGISVAATKAGHGESRPGPTLVVRSSGISEPSFVAPRELVPPYGRTKSVIVSVSYVDFPPEAQSAFQSAINIFATLVSSPEWIRVQASWTPLEGDTLGSARANFIRRGFSGAPHSDVWYPDALADAFFGDDLGNGDFDVIASFNSDYSNWFFGTGGNPPSGSADFISVVLHELLHGIGFSGSATVESGQGRWGHDGFPTAFDLYMEDGAGSSILDEGVYPNPSTALAGALQSNDLFWSGAMAAGANGGVRPRMYAPSTWEVGSSFSHLDEASYPAGHPDSLMTPSISLGEAIHDPGDIAMCMLEEMGWETSQECGGASSGNSYWVATAARASGAGGSQWRTTLGIFNPTGSAATVDLRHHRSGGPMASSMLSIPAGGQTVIDDVVGFVGSGGAGPLEVVSPQQMVVGSRTFNQSASGTFGQYLDGVLPSSGLTSGQSVWLTMLRENADFRTNIGFTNTGSTPAVVSVTLYDGTGAVIVSFSVTVQPGQNSQENQPYLNRGGTNDVDAGYAEVTVDSGSGVLVYGSVIDNLTGDPTTIPMKR